jgi:hypothetical protein
MSKTQSERDLFTLLLTLAQFTLSLKEAIEAIPNPTSELSKAINDADAFMNEFLVEMDKWDKEDG